MKLPLAITLAIAGLVSDAVLLAEPARTRAAFGEPVCYSGTALVDVPDPFRVERPVVQFPEFSLKFFRYEPGGWSGSESKPARYHFSILRREDDSPIGSCSFVVGGYLSPGGQPFSVADKVYVLEMFETVAEGPGGELIGTPIPRNRVIVWDAASARMTRAAAMKRIEKAKAAQPGATDNPDDAQRI